MSRAVLLLALASLGQSARQRRPPVNVHPTLAQVDTEADSVEKDTAADIVDPTLDQVDTEADSVENDKAADIVEVTGVSAVDTVADIEDSLGSAGFVRQLYTFGAPKPSVPDLEDPLSRGGSTCFSGLRIVNKASGLVHSVDVVPSLLLTTSYEHAKVNIRFLYENVSVSRNQSCGWRGSNVETGSTSLHSLAVYVARAKLWPDISPVASVALVNSYERDNAKVAAAVGPMGWDVRTALNDIEVAHLFQNRNTLDCILSFEGSNNWGDWGNNALVATTTFCGLHQRVHTGFRNEINFMIKSAAYKNNIFPKLGRCRNIDVTGHSLGGAMASLFTACAHNGARVSSGQAGYTEYLDVRWTRASTPSRI